MRGSCRSIGGWEGPGPDGVHWMIVKTLVIYSLIFWIRWSWMRYRSDQLMKICWHYLVPASLGILAATAVWVRLMEAA